MTLNSDSNDIGYLLGRLFAVLEKTQKDAVGKDINATIKDRYFGSASATPRAVFPQLLRMSQHHIKKAEYGKRNERMVEEILQHIESFPAHFNLDQQGMFALGYYHQRPAMYKKIQ